MPTPSLLRRFPGRWVAAGLLLAWGAVVGLLVCLEDRLIFHPLPASRGWVDPACRYHDVLLEAATGARIHARWFECPQARGAVLVCHSRAKNLSIEMPAARVAAWHRELGLSVLAFDYPGYGRSEGTPGEAGCYATAEAAHGWLVQTQGVAPERVLLYGQSLGTAVAVELASRRPHRALVLVAPFTSLPDVAFAHCPLLPARLLMRNRFDTLARIGRCPRPVFITHGTSDRVVPFAQGEKVFAAAREPKRFLAVEGGRHGNCVTPDFFRALRRFLGEAALLTSSP